MSSLKKTSSTRFTQTKGGNPMNRVHILLTVMVVMVGALFAAHEAVAKIIIGTDGDDTLIGTDRDDRLKGRGGDDRLKGGRGDDYLDRRGGDDPIKGSRGDDEIEGGEGDDYLNGSRGDDKIAGGGENDEIFPGEGDDVIYAGNGDDLICARDTQSVDYIDCGGGFDKVETIHGDDKIKRNCERALGTDRSDGEAQLTP